MGVRRFKLWLRTTSEGKQLPLSHGSAITIGMYGLQSGIQVRFLRWSNDRLVETLNYQSSTMSLWCWNINQLPCQTKTEKINVCRGGECFLQTIDVKDLEKYFEEVCSMDVRLNQENLWWNWGNFIKIRCASHSDWFFIVKKWDKSSCKHNVGRY